MKSKMLTTNEVLDTRILAINEAGDIKDGSRSK